MGKNMAREPKQPKESGEAKEAREAKDGQDTARNQALEKTLSELTKRFGDGTIVRLGDANHLQVSVIPSGSLAEGFALGLGGISRGRCTQIYGAESSCMTTI